MIDANSQFFAILTNVGMAKQANADALGIPWKITDMGVGDANGTDPIPNAAQTALIHEWRRRPLNQLKIDPNNPAVIIAEQIIPADEGGKWIREIGLYDADGDLVAVANCAPSFKPVLSQGSGRTQIVRMNFIVTSAGNITLKIDPAIVLASRAYVDAAILEVLPKNKTPGEWTRVKTNNLGIVVSGDNPDTLAGMGIKDTYTKPQIEAIVAQASALPIGALVAFPKAAVTPGFLELDGSLQSAATYPDLFAYLGTTFNTGGEGAGYFRLPESRGEFLRGWDHGRGVDAGRALGSYQADEFKKHRHPQYEYDSGGNATPIPDGSFAYDLNANITVGYDRTALIGYAGGNETRPRNVAVMWCIKAWNAPINQGNIDVAALAAQLAAFVPRDYQTGMIMSMSVAAPTTTVELSAGSARGIGNAVVASAVISCVLQSAGVWSAGSGGNKIDTGIRAANTWYHAHVIRKNDSGERDMLFSTGLAPQVPGGYELIARLKGRAIKTDGSGNIIPFINTGNSTDFKTMPQDMFVSNVQTSSYTLAVSVPPGVRVRVRFYARTQGESSVIYVRSPETAAVTLNNTSTDLFVGGIGMSNDATANENMSGYGESLTNPNGQVVAQVLGYPGYSVLRASMHTQGWTEE
ncbi:phage tail-collar fiber domain-containing protein [Pseudomonas migulae]